MELVAQPLVLLGVGMAAIVYSSPRKKKTWFRGCECQGNSEYRVEVGKKSGWDAVE